MLFSAFQIFGLGKNEHQLVLHFLNRPRLLHRFIQVTGPHQIIFCLIKLFLFRKNISQRFTLLSSSRPVLLFFHQLQRLEILFLSAIPVFLQTFDITQIGITSGFPHPVTQFLHGLQGLLVIFPGQIKLVFVEINIPQAPQKIRVSAFVRITHHLYSFFEIDLGLIHLFRLPFAGHLQINPGKICITDSRRDLVLHVFQRGNGFLNGFSHIVHPVPLEVELFQILQFGNDLGLLSC